MGLSTATPATLSDVIRSVKLLLGPSPGVGELRDPNANPNGVEFLIGERYLREEGAPPRIVLVPDTNGTIGPALAVGARQVCGITERVRCYVWGREGASGLDVDRYDDARARSMRLLNAFKASASGRLRGASLVRGVDSNVETFGEEYQLTLAYTWGVPEDAAVWAAAFALLPVGSPPAPDQPQGPTANTFATTSVTLANTRGP